MGSPKGAGLACACDRSIPRGRAQRPATGYSPGVEQNYFQKGFQLKSVVAPVLVANYHSSVVERLKGFDYAAQVGELRLRLAREFGFCYGVDRAVEYAYETRAQFPD